MLLCVVPSFAVLPEVLIYLYLGELPSECLELTAWTEDDTGEIAEIMGVRHKFFPIEGVQFHPESILSEHGHQLLQNFLHL